MTTGYNIREGSRLLTQRYGGSELHRETADAILRRWRIQRLAREALRILDGRP